LKKGFGIITAIIVVAAISGVVMLILMLSSGRVKKTTDEYLKLQAELLAQSTTEYAIMRIEGFDRSNGGCLENITITAAPFDIKIAIRYFMTTALSNTMPNCNAKITPYITDESANGTAIIDVTVKTVNNSTNSQETITINKISLQKP
jgi:hypothetical protein